MRSDREKDRTKFGTARSAVKTFQHRLKSRHTANGVLAQAGLPKQF
jgi:hypothetical protein